MEQDIDTIGQRIKHLREAKSMSQYKLGQLIGSSDTYIAQVESGLVKAPGGEKLVKFAEALETTTDYLLTGKILKIEEITKESQALADLSNIKETITEIEERLLVCPYSCIFPPFYNETIFYYTV